MVAVALISLVIFAALRILPGDVASAMAGLHASPGRVEALRRQFGMNRPLPVQYWSWVTDLLHGNFGMSVATGRSVSSLVMMRAAVTFPLIGLGLAFALVLGIPLGCAAAVSTTPWRRTAYQIVAIVGGAVPALWIGSLLTLLLGKGVGLLGVFPSQGFAQDGWSSPGSALMSLILPASAVGIIVGASVMRYTRSALDDVARTGYIDMAMACGMTRREAVLRTGLRLAAPQLTSVIGLTFAEMITGVMVIENLFALPGLGTGLVKDIGNRDFIAVHSELTMLAALFLVIGFVVDIVHRLLDPRFGTSEGRDR